MQSVLLFLQIIRSFNRALRTVDLSKVSVFLFFMAIYLMKNLETLEILKIRGFS